MYINPHINLDEDEIHLVFIQSTGPGGQSINKVSTAVQLRFDLLHSKSIPEDIKKRLFHLARNKINKDGQLLITARKHRTQEANRRDARDRLLKLIVQATRKPKYRIPQKSSTEEKMRRLREKRQRSDIKRLREKVFPDDG